MCVLFLFRYFCQIISNRPKKKTSPGFFALPPKATAFCTKVVKAVLCKSSGTFGEERMFFLLGKKALFHLWSVAIRKRKLVLKK